MSRSVVPFRVLSQTNLSNRSRHASPNSRPLNLLQPLCPLFPTPILYFQQLAASFSKTPGVGYTRSNRFFEISKLRTFFRDPSCKLVNAIGTVVAQSRSADLSGAPRQWSSSSEVSTSHQSQVTSHAFSPALCFHNLTNPLSRNPFILTTIQIARGCGGASLRALTLTLLNSKTFTLFSSHLTLLREQSIATQRNAPITRSSLRWRLAFAYYLDTSLRSPRPLVAFRAGRRASHHRSVHVVGRPSRPTSLVSSCRRCHRDPGRHSRSPYAGVPRWRKLSLRRRYRPDEYRLDRRGRRLSLRHLRQHRRFRDHESLGRRHLLGSPPATAAGRVLLRSFHRGLRRIRFSGRNRRRLHDRSRIQAVPRRRAEPHRQHRASRLGRDWHSGAHARRRHFASRSRHERNDRTHSTHHRDYRAVLAGPRHGPLERNIRGAARHPRSRNLLCLHAVFLVQPHGQQLGRHHRRAVLAAVHRRFPALLEAQENLALCRRCRGARGGSRRPRGCNRAGHVLRAARAHFQQFVHHGPDFQSVDPVPDSFRLRLSVGLQAGKRLHERAYHSRLAHCRGKTQRRMEHAAASQNFPRQAGGPQAHSGRRQVSLHLVLRHGDGLLPRGHRRRNNSRCHSNKTDKNFRLHRLPNAFGGPRNFRHARPRLRDKILGDRRRLGPGVHSHWMVLPVLRNLPRMARRRAHGKRHFVECIARQVAAHHRRTTSFGPNSDDLGEQRRRRNGQNGGRTIHLRSHRRHESTRQRGHDFPLRVLAFHRARRHRRRDRNVVRVRLPAIRSTRFDLHALMGQASLRGLAPWKAGFLMSCAKLSARAA